MALGEPRDELERLDNCKKHTQALRDRMEKHYSMFRLDKFRMGADEGEWEEYTTNNPAVLGYKIINMLAFARRKLWIPVSDEGKRDRKSLSLTEQLAIGALNMADNTAMAVPEGMSTQSSLSFHSAIRGWTVVRCYMREQDDKVIPDITCWDPLNTYWISGSGKLLWVCYKRYANRRQLETEYGMTIHALEDSHGRILVYDVWDDEEEGVFTEDEWLKEPEKHGLEYPPVYIRPVGAIPLLQSQKLDDTIKDVGPSCLTQNENIFPNESRLLSYMLTRAGMEAKMPIVVEFDSKAGALPPEFTTNPYVKGKVIFLDIAKGQKAVPFVDLPKNSDILQMLTMTQRMESMGGMAPVAYGQIDQALPAQGIDILTQSASDVAKPYKANVETMLRWLAQEITSQYKNGDFGEMELEGFDSKENKFHVEVSPGQIDDNWRFECTLVLDLLRDKMQQIAAASEAVKSGLMSKQTARDKFHLVDDTDLEQQIIDREQIEQMLHLNWWDVAKALFEGGEKQSAQIILNAIMQQGQLQLPGGQPGGGLQVNANMPNPRIPPAARPQIPNVEQQQVSQRMANMGLVMGR